MVLDELDDDDIVGLDLRDTTFFPINLPMTKLDEVLWLKIDCAAREMHL